MSIGAAKRKRSRSCFCLNALVAVEVYVIVYELVRLFECGDFLPVNTFCLENGEEIFCHCIVIWVPTS